MVVMKSSKRGSGMLRKSRMIKASILMWTSIKRRTPDTMVVSSGTSSTNKTAFRENMRPCATNKKFSIRSSADCTQVSQPTFLTSIKI